MERQRPSASVSVPGTGPGEGRAPAPAAPARATEGCVLVIFGISGDLAHRKLVPALFELQREGLLPERFAVLGVSRRPENVEALRGRLRSALAPAPGQRAVDEAGWARLAERIHFARADFESEAGPALLARELRALEERLGTRGNRLFYLATPPDAVPALLAGLRGAGLLHPPSAGEHAAGAPWSRVVLEKPFGHDLESARALNAQLAETLHESQVLRIDHFLGKETVQNILVFRFGNALFEPLWNRKYIDRVEITASETLGVQGRGAFYDEVGVVRDMVQNHLLQVLATVAMELPITFRADDVRDARVALFRSLRTLVPAEVGAAARFGQYQGYRAEPGVAPGSRTPTRVELDVRIDNWRWQGVPFVLRTGKRLAERRTEVVIRFQPIPLCLFGSDEVCRRVEPNVLVLRIAPDEGIWLRFAAKRPGESLDVATVAMDFRYDEAFPCPPADAYQRLLLDALRGDATLFLRRDEIERCWSFVQPLLDAWERPEGEPLPLTPYAPGSE